MKIKAMANSVTTTLQQAQKNAGKVIAKLDTLSPLKTLARGYCITQKEGKVINKAEYLKKEDEISLLFCDGEKKAKVL